MTTLRNGGGTQTYKYFDVNESITSVKSIVAQTERTSLPHSGWQLNGLLAHSRRLLLGDPARDGFFHAVHVGVVAREPVSVRVSVHAELDVPLFR